MANVIRMIACMVVVVGLVVELSFGLLFPTHVVVRYASAQSAHLVQVELPPVGQAATWCVEAQKPDVSGDLLACHIYSDR